ncbi:MAG TPA: flagellar biosynthesis anti-sigma factor FlgM [Bacteroidota bacterium]|jgi:hypothetical protein|nr:flagellar biosynthesis anti-sigma factor FlgM [Bacteroidota bacterium]
MTIREITGNFGTQGLFDKKKSVKKSDEKSKNTDKIELSPKAKELQRAQNEQRIEEINKRIEENFYSKREVLDKIATNILKELQK